MNEWIVTFQGGGLTDPEGGFRYPVWGDEPDVRLAYRLVEQWDERFGLYDSAPRIAASSFWWSMRLLMVQRSVVVILPQLRLLNEIKKNLPCAPTSICLHDPPRSFWQGLFAAVFPDARIRTESSTSGKRMIDLKTLPVRLKRAWASHRRLSRLAKPDPDRPRVLVVSRDRTWDGQKDVELDSAITALIEKGFDVVILGTCGGTDADRLGAWQTRPGDHLFEDIVYFDYFLRHGKPKAPPMTLPSSGMVVEGVDVSGVIAGIVRPMYRKRYLHRYICSQAFDRLLSRIRPQAALLTDENGGNQGIKLGLMQANIPTIAVQHGLIEPCHTSYVYPGRANPESVPLCDITCVYGQFERSILLEQSIYPEEGVEVTGQVQMDSRPAAKMKWRQRTDAGQELRTKTLPCPADRLLLFTSQDVYRSFVGPRLLSALAAGNRRNFLVIRPHPREKDTGFWRELIDHHNVADRTMITGDGTIGEWLDACDVHISSTSTVLIEAVALGRPNIIIGSRQFGDMTACIAEDVAVDLEDFSSLDEALDSWLDTTPEKQLEHEANRGRFIERHFHRLDGKAGERIAGVVEKILSQKTGTAS